MLMLRNRRKELNLTMKQLGELVGVSESAISQYETGKRQADFETLLKLGDVLNCSVDYLLRGTVPPENTKSSSPRIEDELDAELVNRLCQLTPQEQEKVDAFVQGLLASH